MRKSQKSKGAKRCRIQSNSPQGLRGMLPGSGSTADHRPARRPLTCTPRRLSPCSVATKPPPGSATGRSLSPLLRPGSSSHLPRPGPRLRAAGPCPPAGRLGSALPPCLVAPFGGNVTLQGAPAGCWDSAEAPLSPLRAIRIPSLEIQAGVPQRKGSIPMTACLPLHTLGNYLASRCLRSLLHKIETMMVTGSLRSK